MISGESVMNDATTLVGVIMGSRSDWKIMCHATETLEMLGIGHETRIISAHRTPQRLIDYTAGVRGRGVKVIIAGAGMAAALPGSVAALTTLPVLGVPMESNIMGGLDALLSMTQMPGGIPVGTLAVGKAGAVNAALLAGAILALNDENIAASLDSFRARQTANVAETP